MLDTVLFLAQNQGMFSAVLVAFLSGMLGGALGALAYNWGLSSKVYELQLDLETLKDRLTIEVKKRAGQMGRRAQEVDQEILEAAKRAPTAAPVPWWAQYTTKP